MKADVNNFVTTCETCQRVKGQKAPVSIQPLKVPGLPFEEITYDFIVKLPVTRDGNDSILVVVDHLSKFAHFIPCKEASTAEDVANMFLQNMWRYHGLPERTISDRGSTFNSNFLKALFEKLQITPKFSTTYHPQTDGQSERVNQWLEQYLRTFIGERQDDWDQWLALAEFCHNNSRNASTGKAPFTVVYGRLPRLQMASGTTKVPRAEDHAKEMEKV